MKFKNLSRVERNMLTGLFCQFVTILLSFLMPRLYLTYYGSGVNGELNTIKQLFASTCSKRESVWPPPRRSTARWRWKNTRP